MAQYIDKDALVAEIDKQKIGYNTDGKHPVEYNTVKKILDILDTLEVKEIGVDLGDPEGDKSAKYIIDTKTLEVRERDVEEKATQLSQKYFPNEENIWARSNIEAQKCKSACMEMVEWLKSKKGE